MGSLDVIGAIADGWYFDEKGNKLAVNTAAVSYTVATAGDQATPVVAAVAGKRIRVLAMALTTSINGPSCFLRSGTGGTQISELILRNISGSTSAMNYQRTAYYPIFLYQTNAGQALVLNASATGTCSVQVVYVLV
jgi:hypothetical protein